MAKTALLAQQASQVRRAQQVIAVKLARAGPAALLGLRGRQVQLAILAQLASLARLALLGLKVRKVSLAIKATPAIRVRQVRQVRQVFKAKLAHQGCRVLLGLLAHKARSVKTVYRAIPV